MSSKQKQIKYVELKQLTPGQKEIIAKVRQESNAPSTNAGAVKVIITRYAAWEKTINKLFAAAQFYEEESKKIKEFWNQLNIIKNGDRN